MNVIERLTQIDINRADLNDMVELLSAAEPVRAKFETLDIPVPEALSDGLRTLSREVKRRADDAIEMRLRELDAQDTADRSTTERRDARRAEREKLLAKRRNEATATEAANKVAQPA